MVLILRPEDTRGLITMKEAVEATETAFRDWGQHPGVNAPRRRTHVPSGVRVSVHQGGTATLGMTGLFTHCELVHPMSEEQVYEAIADPAYVLFDARTAALACVILGEITPAEMPDTVVMTGLRTATTSAVGTHLLARSDARTVGLFGAGSQSRYHLLALKEVRPLAQVKVYRRDAIERRRFAEEMTDVLQTEVIPVERPEDCVRGMDIVVAATNASVPVFDGAWLEPGQHVASIVGGDRYDERREVDDATVARADLVAMNSVQQARLDAQDALPDPGALPADKLVEVGPLLAGTGPRRTDRDQITLHLNNTGQGIQFAAVGAMLYERARAAGRGHDLPAEWFVTDLSGYAARGFHPSP